MDARVALQEARRQQYSLESGAPALIQVGDRFFAVDRVYFSGYGETTSSALVFVTGSEISDKERLKL